MIAIEINKEQLDRLQAAVIKSGKAFPKVLNKAINDTAKKTKREMGRAIRDEVAMKKAESEKPLSIKLSTTSVLQAVVSLKRTPRLGLRHFGAKQDKSGVSYKISAKGGKSRVEGAFQGPKPGVMNTRWKGNVFVRHGGKVKMTKGRHKGRMRQQIQMIRGVSAYGAYVKNDLKGPQVVAIEKELHAQIERQIREQILRANGIIK